MPGETVLIIEDDPTMLRGLRDNFEYVGYHVATAAEMGLGADDLSQVGLREIDLGSEA